MKRLLNIIGKKFQINTVQNLLNIVEYTQRENKRNVYINGGVFEENKMDLIFLIDTGDWFYKTIRFDIAINTYDNKLVIRKGYGYDYIEYELNQFNLIVEYITQEIIAFGNQDKENRKNKISIKKRKIV